MMYVFRSMHMHEFRLFYIPQIQPCLLVLHPDMLCIINVIYHIEECIVCGVGSRSGTCSYIAVDGSGIQSSGCYLASTLGVGFEAP